MQDYNYYFMTKMEEEKMKKAEEVEDDHEEEESRGSRSSFSKPSWLLFTIAGMLLYSYYPFSLRLYQVFFNNAMENGIFTRQLEK